MKIEHLKRFKWYQKCKKIHKGMKRRRNSSGDRLKCLNSLETMRMRKMGTVTNNKRALLHFLKTQFLPASLKLLVDSPCYSDAIWRVDSTLLNLMVVSLK